MTDLRGKICIVRCESAGVFFGEVADVDGSTVELRNARRIWYWEGACSCSDLALIGTSKPDDCKFTRPVDSIVLLGAIEMIPATDEAISNISRVRPWTISKDF